VYLISDFSGKWTVIPLVVAKVRERLAESKQTIHKFHTERFSLKKLNENSLGLKSEKDLQLWKT
jgi:anti-sigma-K factor RskA